MRSPFSNCKEIATRHHLQIIEDACQAINAEYKYKDGHTAIAGSMGMAGCLFSLLKIWDAMAMAEPSILIMTNLPTRCAPLPITGCQPGTIIERIGINSRLDAIQAILSVKLQHLDEYTTARQTAAQRYLTMLSDCNGITLPQTANYSTRISPIHHKR